MKHYVASAAVIVVMATQGLAETVAPQDVAFEDGAVAMSLTGMPGDAANGEKLMNKGAGNCVACHQITSLDYLSFQGNIGPALDGVAGRWSEAELRGIVANAKNTFDGTMMPAFYKDEGFTRLGNAYTGKAHEGPVEPLLSAQQIEDVIAYLMTLKDE